MAFSLGPKQAAMAAIRIQRFFRQRRQTKMTPKRLLQRITQVQARFRQRRTRARYLAMLANRAPWKDFLRPGECVVLTSQVVKISSISSSANLFTSRKTRQLILTTGGNELEEDINTCFPPRLFYVDSTTRKWKGEIPYELDLLAGFANKQQLLLFSRGNDDKPGKKPVWQFSLPSGGEITAVDWIQVLKRPLSVWDLVAKGKPGIKPILHRGQTEMVLEGKSIPCELILTPSELYWKNEGGIVVGGTTLGSNTQMRLLDPIKLGSAAGQNNFPFLLRSKSAFPNKDIEFRVASLGQSVQWSSQIENSIVRCVQDCQRFGDTATQAFRVFEHGKSLLELEEDYLGAKLKFTDAIALLTCAKRKETELVAQCFAQRAQCNFSLGLFARASWDCTESIALRPVRDTDDELVKLRSLCNEKLGHFVESLKDLDALLKRHPQDLVIMQSKQRITKWLDFETHNSAANANIVEWSKPTPIARMKHQDSASSTATSSSSSGMMGGKRSRHDLLKRDSSGALDLTRIGGSGTSSPLLMKRTPSRTPDDTAGGSMRGVAARAEDGIYASLRRISLREELTAEQLRELEMVED
ncbi:hypothetical protein BASA81_015069 [Batrachochytrium salamandrivorans]|nr:hypothetical protein BASA81_015069 [Batrachochytrium salamandrivorans]